MNRRLLLAGLLLPAAAVAQGFSGQQRAEIERIIGELLRRDPKILRDALAALEAEESASRAANATGVIAANLDLLIRDPADPVVGNPNGTLSIVEFSDYRCPYCRRAHPELRRLLAEDPTLRLVAKELPILGAGSVVMARAALAAHRQGRWQAANARLIAFQGEPTEAAIIGTLLALGGLDEGQLRRDMADPAIARQLQGNIRLARAIGITGTPAFVIGTRLHAGAMDHAALRQAVGEARSGTR